MREVKWLTIYLYTSSDENLFTCKLQVQYCYCYRVTLLHDEGEDDEEHGQSVYLHFVPRVILSSFFLRAVTFSHVLHLDVL